MRQGEALEQGKNLKQTSIGSHTLATFPATVGFFAFSLDGEKEKKGKARGGAAKRLREERFGDNADIKKMRKKIIKIRKIAQKHFTKEKNTNII